MWSHQNAESTKDYTAFQEMWPSQGGRTEELWKFLSRWVFYEPTGGVQEAEVTVDREGTSGLVGRNGGGVSVGQPFVVFGWTWRKLLPPKMNASSYATLASDVSKQQMQQAHFIRAKHEKDEDDCVNVGVQNCLCFEYASLTVPALRWDRSDSQLESNWRTAQP